MASEQLIDPLDETCDSCGAPANPVGSYWFAPNDLWNEIEGTPYAMRCPSCFVADATEKGVAIGFRAGIVGEIED